MHNNSQDTSLNKIINTLIVFFTLSLSPVALSAEGKHHILGLFLGATNVDGETDSTWGIEYEYKFNNEWGIGAVYEETPDGHDGDGVNVKVASLFYRPTSNWRFGVGFGQEKIEGKKPKTKDLYRLVGSYDFHIGDFGIAPTLAIDFIDGGKDAFVFGIAIVRPF
jgi:hypothetical protein